MIEGQLEQEALGRLVEVGYSPNRPSAALELVLKQAEQLAEEAA